ncbi:hypothetical protein TNCV_670381 [Trichonephila clavipes]|nr:hypothetical protein TNCV_670381 [Trichonephila clavipes]
MALGTLVCGLDGQRRKEEWDDKKRVENREESLGYPGFVTPVFTKDSKPLGKRKRSLGHLAIVTPYLDLREFGVTQFSNLVDSSSFFPIIKTQAESLPEPIGIGNLIKEVADVAMQINSEVDNDDVQKLLDSHNQELTIDELTEMHEQEQDIEQLESVDSVQSED